MSIVREILDNGLVRTHSNAGVKIHGGFPEADYDVVYDPEEANRTYVETNIPVDKESLEPGPTQYSKLKILMAAQQSGFIDSLVQFLNADLTTKMIWDASNVIEDNALLSNYIPQIAAYLEKTEEEIRTFLNEHCIAD